jgi:hypothetical protein
MPFLTWVGIGWGGGRLANPGGGLYPTIFISLVAIFFLVRIKLL